VGGVMGFHFLFSYVRGGYLGVDAFFVLSGYLITSLLLVEWDRHGTIDFGAFWARRARRLLPALFVVLLATTLIAALTFDAAQLERFRGEGLAALFYSLNWFYIVSGPAGDVAGLSPLDHMWSLAIEEQFYLVWPLVVFATLTLTRGRHWALGLVALAVSIVSVILMAALWVPGDIDRVYKGTDTRAHQLLIGAILAVALLNGAVRRVSDRVAPWLAIPAAVFCVVAMLRAPSLEDRAFLYHGGSVTFALAVAVVIAAGVTPRRSLLKGALSLAPLVWLGRISYGLYLWHVPVYVALSPDRIGLENPALVVARVGVTVACAALSYYLVEMPIRRGAPGVQLTRFATPVAILGVVVAVLIATTYART
jgi:peptidoglycan/LPS O-acetylase OafA/YrhL